MESLQPFNALNLPNALSEHLATLGFATPTPIQSQAIPIVVSGKDLLGIAPTGTGKTGAFGIPAVANLSGQTEKQVLVIAPTRELAAQIFQFMRQLSTPFKLRGALLVGGESFRRQADDVRAGADYLVATPGRLMDHVNRGLELAHVGILILDEVDQMLDMGFAPQVEEIVSKTPKNRQTLFFSATMPAPIQKMVQRYLKDPIRVTVGQNPAQAPKIREERINMSPSEKGGHLQAQVTNRTGKILIFARTQRGAEQIARLLEAKGTETACLHGGRTQGERKLAMDAFRRGRVRVMVATDIAARGIDVPDIETVINFDYPATKEDYLHRIGRTGRCGKEGVAITFVDGVSYSRGRPQQRSQFSGGGGRGPERKGPPRHSNRPHFRANGEHRLEDPQRKRLGVQAPAVSNSAFKESPKPLPLKTSSTENKTVVETPAVVKPTTFSPRSPASRPRKFETRRKDKEKKRESRSNHSGSVRYFNASDTPAAAPARRHEGLLNPPKPRTSPDWVRTEKGAVRRKGAVRGASLIQK